MPTTATATVRIDVPRDTAWRRASLVLGSTTGMALAAWIAGWQSWPAWAAVAAMTALAVVGATIGLAWLRAPAGRLSRHGNAWWWHAAGQADMAPDAGTRGDVAVTIDLGRWMLVRFEPVPAATGCLWLPLSLAVAGPDWCAWRSLLLSSRATAPTTP